MDKYVNQLIEKAVNKPMSGYQRELIKGGLLVVIGLLIGIIMLISDGFRSFDFTWFIIVLYPLGFYYGWRTIFKLMRGKGSGATEAGLVSAFFSGNGMLGFIVGTIAFIISMMIALVFGWIVGFINFYKTLMYYKIEDQQKSTQIVTNE